MLRGTKRTCEVPATSSAAILSHLHCWTERFGRLRVMRVLERIAADLDHLSRLPNEAHADKESDPQEAQARHRHEVAEPSREPKKLSHQEQRKALRAALGLPPQ